MSHASGFDPYAEAVKVREPVARPLDVVAFELVLSASQAFLVGVLMYLAIGVWGDRGVGAAPVAAILAMLGLVVGGAWCYWLLGGVGWPLAAADVPVAMFLGFALVLGWTGSDLFGVTGIPLLLATLAAVYGIIGGVFIDSPRRWRWDQRQRLRPGTPVPRVSEATHRAVAAVPRSIPRRAPPPPPPGSDLAARIEKSTPAGPGPGGDIGTPYIDADHDGAMAAPGAARPDQEQATTDAVTGEGPAAATADDDTRIMPTQRLSGAAPAPTSPPRDRDEDETGAIVLPTSVEPKAQRSPWAWAAPPDWNRDDDDEGGMGPSSKRS